MDHSQSLDRSSNIVNMRSACGGDWGIQPPGGPKARGFLRLLKFIGYEGFSYISYPRFLDLPNLGHEELAHQLRLVYSDKHCDELRIIFMESRSIVFIVLQKHQSSSGSTVPLQMVSFEDVSPRKMANGGYTAYQGKCMCMYKYVCINICMYKYIYIYIYTDI